MRSALLVSALVGLAAANPVPQSIDFDEIDAAATPTIEGPPVNATIQTPTYNPAAAAVSASAAATSDPMVTSTSTPDKLKRQDVNAPCAVQPDGYGPKTTPDTAAAFLANKDYKAIADLAPTPPGYSLSFQNLQGSTSEAGYMGLYTLQSYDTYKCQEYCDSVQYCTAINIYIERDPSENPATGCVNPSSITNFKCTLWGNPVTKDSATNTGQWRDQFQVVITGSNGYTKNAPPPACSGFTGPTEFAGAINAPLNSANQNTYMGMKYFPGLYDPGLCAAACTSTTAYDHRHATNGKYDACNFFNSYIISIAGIPQGTYCSMYTQPWGKPYDTNVGQWRGPLYYGVGASYGYTLNPQDSGIAK